MKSKTKLIFNPIANLGRAWTMASGLRPVVAELGGADWAGTVYPGHATELAHQAALEGYDTVIAMGGDGTVHEVLNGLMQVPEKKRPVMGIVPVGSGNDLAFAAGISKQPEQAMIHALTGSAKVLDIGLVQDNLGRQEYWANSVGVGFDTIVTIRSRKVPLLQGFSVYLMAVLQTILLDYHPFTLDIQLDDRAWKQESMLFVMMNGVREGGGFHVAPASRPDDGQLDYLAVNKVTRLKMLQILPAVLNGTHGRMKECQIGTFHQASLSASDFLYIHLDGEIFATPSAKVKDLQVKLLAGALTIRV